MTVDEKLYARIKSKITENASARVDAIIAREPGADIHDSMWAFSHRAADAAKNNRELPDYNVVPLKV